ncbi:MAG: bifunctional metallophosphatase/5'-nucleotidase [Ruminococcus sp.]|nr:bifunctional metallophosphatase/5'-nucleotidase [Ruminococcus sp.]
MMLFKKITAIFATACILMSQSVCIPADAESQDKGIVILHTNDIHCGMYSDDNTFGYAELAGYAQKLEDEGYDTIIVDAGDAVQGGIVGYMSDGQYIVDIMNEVGYDVAIPGNHEFDYGMDEFMDIVANANHSYLSSNFVSLETGDNILDSYKIIEKDGVKIGFVGITTPETITSSTPKYFMNDDGEYIYGFCGGDNGQELYDKVQNAVDDALNEGADYIVAIGHLGVDASSKPWTSQEVISNVSGIDVFIDGHSHSVIESEFVLDKDGKEVILNSCGTQLMYVGEITISDDDVSAKLIGKSDYSVSTDESSNEYLKYKNVLDFVNNIESAYIDDMNEVVAESKCELIIYDPETGDRLIRNTQTNMGDFVADAYRIVSDADIGLVNGGGIRAEIKKGDITFGDVINVNPFGNLMCVVEATGQQILDALELGAMYTPDENGGFLHVSGMTYEIHTYIPSSVVLDENQGFLKVDGEYRVKNVMVGDEPLDLDKTYKVASYNYLLKNGGDGATMFYGCKLLKDETISDNELLVKYVQEYLNGVIGLEYENPMGEGRIVKVTEKPVEDTPTPEKPPESETKPDQTPPATGTEGLKTVTVILSFALVLAVIKSKK